MHHFFMLTPSPGLLDTEKEKSSELKLSSARTTSSSGVSAPALTPRLCTRHCRQTGLHRLPWGLGMNLQNWPSELVNVETDVALLGYRALDRAHFPGMSYLC